MSIYSGFATRQQEQTYDENINSILYILQKRLIKFFKGEPANDAKFIDLFTKIYLNLKNLENSKYLNPKLSNSLNEIAEYLKGKRLEYIAVETNEKDQNIPIKQSENLITPIKQLIKQPKTQKLIITERLAKNHQRDINTQRKGVLIRKRNISDSHHKSTNLVNSQYNKSKEISNSILYHSPRISNQMLNKLSKPQFDTRNKIEQNIRNSEGKGNEEDVRDLIRGYLIKRKKNFHKDSDKSKHEIQQVFKPH